MSTADKPWLKFDAERIEKIRAALIESGFEPQLMPDGKSIKYRMVRTGSCVLPTPEIGPDYFFDTPHLAAEAIKTLVGITGKPMLELGPITAREWTYAEEISLMLQMLQDRDEHISTLTKEVTEARKETAHFQELWFMWSKPTSS